MALLHRKRVLVAKIETTPGTAIAISGDDGEFNVFDAVMQPEIEFEKREGQSAFSQLKGVSSAEKGTCTFRLEVTGNADAGDPVPVWAETFLPACGMVLGTATGETTTFSPLSEAPGTNCKSLTIGLYEDGLLKKLTGAVGNAEFIFTAGKLAAIEFSFEGVWNDPADVAIVAPDYPSAAPLRFVSSSLTLDAYTPIVNELRVNLNNEITVREDSTKASGYICGIITGRDIAGSLNPETGLVATQDSYGDWLGDTEMAASWVLGATAGNIVTFEIPKFQFTNLQEAEREGVLIDDIEFQANRDADAGDDEFTIAFS